jgi:hypothetical protein
VVNCARTDKLAFVSNAHFFSSPPPKSFFDADQYYDDNANGELDDTQYMDDTKLGDDTLQQGTDDGSGGNGQDDTYDDDDSPYDDVYDDGTSIPTQIVMGPHLQRGY